jgi:hypothetical protein
MQHQNGNYGNATVLNILLDEEPNMKNPLLRYQIVFFNETYEIVNKILPFPNQTNGNSM